MNHKSTYKRYDEDSEHFKSHLSVLPLHIFLSLRSIEWQMNSINKLQCAQSDYDSGGSSNNKLADGNHPI